MSIFVQQPRRKKGLSGLGAFNELLPAIRERGVAAIVDAEWACDYELIYASVYDELSRLPLYRGRTEALRADSAVYAHTIWLQRCPQASYVVNNYNLYDRADGVWGPGPHHHRRHHHHHGGHGGGAGHAAGGAGGGAWVAARASGPMPHTAPMGPGPVHYAARAPSASTRMSTPVHHVSHAPSARGGMPRQSRSHRGLGDGAEVISADMTRRLQQQITSTRYGTTPVTHSLTPQQQAQVQQQTVSPAYQTAMQTSDAMPMPAASFSIEGALPTAVAGLLGLGLGLTVISMIVK